MAMGRQFKPTGKGGKQEALLPGDKYYDSVTNEWIVIKEREVKLNTGSVRAFKVHSQPSHPLLESRGII